MWKTAKKTTASEEMTKKTMASEEMTKRRSSGDFADPETRCCVRL
jgi:hypothetical protein